MSTFQSHDGFPLGCIERSSHLEEYTRSRPASAGGRPRSLLNKMANAAVAVQLDDDDEPADAEPWVLEGWGDGPSVSEAAQQAALSLGPYVKNVPTTLVGLGVAGGRRVCSAGHQGRGPLKISEARRKPGPGPPYSQNDRRVSGPPVLAAGGPGAIATLRKAAMQRTLEVGDESDVEPPGPAACAPVGDGASQGPPPGAYNRITPAQRAGAALRQQNAQQILQSTLNAAARLGRRDSSSSSILPSAPPGHAAGQPGAAVLGNASTEHSVGGVSPRHRSVSAETYLPSTHGVGVTTAAHTPNVAGRITGPGPGTMGPAHGHPPLPPQHPSTHLEPLNTAPIRATTGRFSTGPSDPGMVSVDRPCTGSLVSVDSQPPRSASFSSFAASPPPAGVQDCHDPLSTHPPNHAFPGAAPMTLAVAAPPASQPAAGSTSPTALATSHCGLTGPPMLPGLYANGRRVGSFRNEGLGLSGWDTEPPVVTHQSAAQAATNITLWVGPAGAGALQHTMVLGTSALGRVSPLSIAPTQTRRDTSSRIIRAPGCTSMGLLDLSIGPDRSNDKAGQGLAPTGSRAGRTPSSLGMVPGRSLSPDVGTRGSMTGYSAPQQDALTEFCANRAELGSAGIGAGNISGAAPSDVRVVVNPNSVLVGAPIAMPMRVTSLSKATAVGRVS